MVSIKIISAREETVPHASGDASGSPPDARAPASPRAEPLDSPPLGSSPPSPTTPPSPRRYPAPRAPQSLGESSREGSGDSSRASPGSSVAAAPPAVRAARHTLESVLELADQLETEKLNADAAARRAFAAERDARRERARREAADVRFDALSRLYVAKFKEEVRVDADTRNATEPPASGALKKLTLPKEEKIPVKKIPAPVSRSFASAVTDDIDAVFREARELFLRGHVSRIETCHEDSSLDSTLATSDVSALSSSTTSSFEAEAELADFVVDGATRETFFRETRVASEGTNVTKDDRRQSELTVIARLGGSVGAVHTNYRRETLPGWTFTGVVKDTKFRKKCPMHEGPCADCCSTTRVPFRPTKGGTGHGDPLCPKCLVLRREHRTSTSDWNGAKNGEKAF
jgi:hypothetical protein